MSLSTFFKVSLPYYLTITDVDKLQLFNREYSPIGFNKVRFCTENLEVPTVLKINANGAKKLMSVLGEPNEDGRIYLYTPNSCPSISSKYMDLYLAKLKGLAFIDITPAT